MPSTIPKPRTLYDKVFQDHIVHEKSDGTITLYIGMKLKAWFDRLINSFLTDRHLVHEVSSPQAFEGLRNANRQVRRPENTLATMDHVSSPE